MLNKYVKSEEIADLLGISHETVFTDIKRMLYTSEEGRYCIKRVFNGGYILDKRTALVLMLTSNVCHKKCEILLSEYMDYSMY